MEIDRDLIVQVGITVAVVAVFVVALAVLSSAYGNDVTVEEELNGTIDGTYAEDIEDGNVTLTFDGTYDNSIEAMVDGTITGTVENGTLDGAFEGDISGAIDGTATGTVTNATLDEEQFKLEGSFEGTANGTTAKGLTEQGGLLLIGLMAAFLVAMPVFGYLIQRLKTGDEE
jgi:hypothetical protein